MISTRFLFLATGILSTEVYGMSSPSPRDVPTSIGPLLSRQYSGSTTSSISSACVDSCAILYALAVSFATAPTMIRVDAQTHTADQYAVCMDCQVRLNNSLQTEAQQWMDTYVDACKEVGVAVKSQKISGAGRITIGAGAIGVVLMTVLAVL
ncbi:uncharacterized protein EV420DRAFT_1482249 [Desarmillaria tabescens]|uniref:Uncharacterized protein n=1 Tax=Armillaria tabescens TaxID=1929756 RepID=A0AA39N012_ARMTA|nr:uncharacterized protein EV420DRAFT_1482249 [Desarmillaria tabescens]KAK0452165.1 hypothetical protein EV420DRAFT_1482249 [Desarmillaria tabescens]